MFYLVPITYTETFIWRLFLKSRSEKLHFFIEVDTQKSYLVFYSDIPPFLYMQKTNL